MSDNTDFNKFMENNRKMVKEFNENGFKYFFEQPKRFINALDEPYKIHNKIMNENETKPQQNENDILQ